jgi:hypothetical protein
VSLRAPRFAVVVGRGLDAEVAAIPTPDTGPLPGGAVEATPGYTAAVEALEERLKARPGDRGRLSVVPVYEGELA